MHRCSKAVWLKKKVLDHTNWVYNLAQNLRWVHLGFSLTRLTLKHIAGYDETEMQSSNDAVSENKKQCVCHISVGMRKDKWLS